MTPNAYLNQCRRASASLFAPLTVFAFACIITYTTSPATARARTDAADTAPATPPPKIVRQDTRLPLSGTARFPWSAIGMIQTDVTDFVDGNGDVGPGVFLGTGVLIGPRTVLTAAHVALPGGRRPEAIFFIPGKDGRNEPFGRIPVVAIHEEDGYLPDQDADHDIALLRLESPIGHVTGWLPVEVPREVFWNSGFVYTAGIPIDADAFDMRVVAGRAIGLLNDVRIAHDLDTTTGHSGGPLWRSDLPDLWPRVVGVHIGGATGDEFEFNIGLRLTPQRLTWIETTIEAEAVEGDRACTRNDTYCGAPQLCGPGIGMAAFVATAALRPLRRRATHVLQRNID
jgi:V8-like Glu-specific endopeptidase